MAIATASSGGRTASELLRLAVHVIRGRWFSLFASFLIMAGAGATYLFGVYSKDIKSSLEYDQTTLNLLGFFKDLGANIGVLSGIIAELAPIWLVLLIGAMLNVAGYLMIWLAVTGKIAKPRVWQMCIYMCIAANSQNFANTGALVTSIRNFPESRGVVIGLLKGFTGLSGAIMTQLYLAIYGNDSKSLILLVGWLPAVVSLLFVRMIREMKVVRHPNELRVFYHCLYVSIVLALFLMVMTLAQKMVTFSEAAYASSATVVCALLFVPLYISIREELVHWELQKEQILEHPSQRVISENQSSLVESKDLTRRDSTPPGSVQLSLNPTFAGIVQADLLPQASSAQNPKDKTTLSWFLNIINKPERGENYSILQALLSTDMLIVLFAACCGLGSSLTAVDNLGQIGESLGYPTKTIKTFVSLLSIWNYFGRIFSGFVSENLLAKYKFPRPLMITLVLLLSCIGHLLIAFPIPGSVCIASIIIGFSFGAQLPLVLAIISELFGLKHYSTLFNCGQLAIPLSSYILNVKVTGFLYDKEALKELAEKGMSRSSVNELTCIGTQCYRVASVILASVTFMGALASLILVLRTKGFYKGDIYEKFRNEEEAKEIHQLMITQ